MSSGGLINLEKKRRKHTLITYHQIELACAHLTEMISIGARKDLAGRTLDVFVDLYAKMFHGGRAAAHGSDQIHLDWWSKAAKELRSSGKQLQQGDIQVEHGTPRRRLSELVLKTYQDGCLSAVELDRIVKERWAVAVVTREEHIKLKNNELPQTPQERWTAAGIIFCSKKT